MNGKQQTGGQEPGSRASETQNRVIGSPLPVGAAARTPVAPRNESRQGIQNVSLPGRGLAPDASVSDAAANLQRTIATLLAAFPFVQKILPLFDNSAGNPVTSFLTTPSPPPPQAPALDLEPIENHLVELRAHHRDLRNQVQEQNTSIKRVEDQLEQVREATDRNTLEQQELMEDLKTVGTKVNFFAVLVLLLLAGSVLLNILLYLHISRILP
jgi:hypothetical protein